MHYYPHHIGDFIRDTARLSDSQTIAYLRLMWSYYDKEQPLENSPRKLAFQVGALPEDIELILEHFFVFQDDVWRHRRCDAEISEFHGKKEKAAASANARWKRAKDMRTHSDGNALAPKNDANQEPITNNQEIIDTADKSARSRGTVLKTYVDQCKADGVKPIPDDHHCRVFAQDAGIEPDMLAMCWFRFLEDHTTGARSAKRYKDWGQAFGNAVKANWYKFWFMGDDGVQWTSQGRMYKTAYDVKRGE